MDKEPKMARATRMAIFCRKERPRKMVMARCAMVIPVEMARRAKVLSLAVRDELPPAPAAE